MKRFAAFQAIFARPKRTPWTRSHTPPQRPRGGEWRPRGHGGGVSVSAARSLRNGVAITSRSACFTSGSDCAPVPKGVESATDGNAPGDGAPAVLWQRVPGGPEQSPCRLVPDTPAARPPRRRPCRPARRQRPPAGRGRSRLRSAADSAVVRGVSPGSRQSSGVSCGI